MDNPIGLAARRLLARASREEHVERLIEDLAHRARPFWKNALVNIMEDTEYLKEQAEHKTAHVISTLMKGVSAAASVGAILRYLNARHYFDFDTASMLHRFGLSRRRSAWGTLALLGVGAIAGAGIAIFSSPKSGRDTRQGFVRGFRNVGRKSRDLFRSAGEQIGQLAEGGDGSKEREREPGQKKEQKSGEREGRQAGAGESAPRAGMSMSSSEGVNREAGKPYRVP